MHKSTITLHFTSTEKQSNTGCNMKNISIACYCFQVKQKFSRNNYILLDDFHNRTDIFEEFRNYLNYRHNEPSLNESEQQLLRVERVEENTSRRLFVGILKKGDHGYETDIVSIDDGKKVYERKVSDAELLPFYYLIFIPKKSDKGIIFLQTFGRLGIKTLLKSDFEDFFHNDHPDFLIEMNRLVPSDFFRRYITDGEIKKIKFTQYRLPSDIADKVTGENIDEESGYVELIIGTRRGQKIDIWNQIQTFLNGGSDLGGIIKLDDFGEFSPETVKIQVNLNNTKRTIDVNKLREDELGMNINITDEVQKGNDGHPTFDSINRVSQKYLVYFQRELRLNENVGQN